MAERSYVPAYRLSVKHAGTGTGIISRTVYPAGKRITGKDRGEWMKLTDQEAALIHSLREKHAHTPSAKPPT